MLLFCVDVRMCDSHAISVAVNAGDVHTISLTLGLSLVNWVIRICNVTTYVYIFQMHQTLKSVSKNMKNVSFSNHMLRKGTSNTLTSSALHGGNCTNSSSQTPGKRPIAINRTM